MRISGGTARGVRLQAPRGVSTRPATDQAREALFSSLGARIQGARILDLYAGTGAYGLESLSRGAAEAVFVESARAAVSLLEKNLEAVMKSATSALPQWAGRGRIFSESAERFLKRSPAERFHWIFADPPYADFERAGILLFRVLPAWLEPGGSFILEMPVAAPLKVPDWELTRDWKFGGTRLAIFRMAARRP